MDEVYLWLGANVMLAYPVDEAAEMLQEKLSAAEASLAICEEDADFLREQITVRCPFLTERKKVRIANLVLLADVRGCYGPRVQLGCCAEKKGESRRQNR